MNPLALTLLIIVVMVVTGAVTLWLTRPETED